MADGRVEEVVLRDKRAEERAKEREGWGGRGAGGGVEVFEYKEAGSGRV